jgi:hypothetical protein
MDAMPISYGERIHCCHQDSTNPNADNQAAWMGHHERCEPPTKWIEPGQGHQQWANLRRRGVTMWMAGVQYPDKTIVVYSNDYLLDTQVNMGNANTCYRAKKGKPDPTTPPVTGATGASQVVSPDWEASTCDGMGHGSVDSTPDTTLACYQDVDVVVQHSDDALVLKFQGTAVVNAGATWGFSNLVVTAGKSCGNYAHFDVNGLADATTATMQMHLFRHPLATHPTTGGGVNGKCTLSFWYMMHGPSLGQILVYSRVNTNVAEGSKSDYSGDGLEYNPLNIYPKGSIVSVPPAGLATRCPTANEMLNYAKELRWNTFDSTWRSGKGWQDAPCKVRT